MEKAVRIIALIYLILSLVYIISSVFVLITVYNFGRYIFDEKASSYNSYEYNFFQRMIMDYPFGIFEYKYKHFADDPYLEDVYHVYLFYFSIGIFICSALILFRIPTADYLFLFILSFRLPFKSFNFYLVFYNIFHKLKINLMQSTLFIELLFLFLDLAVIILLLIFLTGKTYKFAGFILKKISTSFIYKIIVKKSGSIFKTSFITIFLIFFILTILSSYDINLSGLKNIIPIYHNLRFNIVHYYLLNTKPPQKRVQYQLIEDQFILEIDYDKFMESFKNDFCKYIKEIKPGRIDLGLYFLIKDYYSSMSCINLNIIFENEKIDKKNSLNDFYYYICGLALKENALIYDKANKKYLRYLKGHYFDDGIGGSTDYTYGKYFLLSEGFWTR